MSVVTIEPNNNNKSRLRNPNAVANLIPFSSERQPESNGRPKGSKNASTVLRELLETEAPDELLPNEFIRLYAKNIKGKPTVKDALAARLAYQAINKGSEKAMALLYDRVDGKAHQSVSITNDQENTELRELLGTLLRAFLAAGNVDSRELRLAVIGQAKQLEGVQDVFGEDLEGEAKDWIEGEVLP